MPEPPNSQVFGRKRAPDVSFPLSARKSGEFQPAEHVTACHRFVTACHRFVTACHRFVTALFGAEKCAMEKRVCVLVAREFELRDIYPQCVNAFQPFLKRSRARFLPGPPLITLRAMVIHQWFMNGQGWFMNGQGWLRSRHVAEVSQAFFDRHFRPIHRLMPRVRSYRTLRHFACCQGLLRVDIQSEHPANSDSRCCESAMPQRYHFVTSTPKKTCLKDLSRATSPRSWTTER